MATSSWTVTKQMMAASNTGAANPGDLHIPIGYWSAGTGYATRATLYAPIDFSGKTAINEARLYMRANAPASGYHTKGTSNGTIYAFRKTADWSETSHGGSAAIDELWGANGAWVVNDYLDAWGGSQQTYGNMSDGTWYYMVITEIVQDWFAGHPNYGLMLYNASSESSASVSKQFWSRHASGSQPYIWVDYSTNTAPLEPHSLYPTGSVVTHTGTNVTLSGYHNDVDAGEYITGVHVQVYDDALSTNYVDYYWNPGGTSFAGTFTHPQGNKWYQWRARTADKNGVWGPLGGFNRYLVNTPPSQPSGAISETPTGAIKTLTPTFNITRNDGDAPYGDYMGGYQIHMYAGAPAGQGTFVWDSGATAVAAGTSTAVRGYNGPALSWGTTYYWYPKTYDAYGAWSDWNYQVPSFTTYKAELPVNLAPANTVVGSLTPTFTGDRGSTSYTVSVYAIEVYEANGTTLKWASGDLATGITNGATFSKAYAGAALSYNTEYKWRAAVSGNIGGSSGWTAMQTFTTPSSTTPTQTAPLGSPITTLTPTFTGAWNEALNGIQLVVYESDGVTVKHDSGTVAKTSATTYSHVYAGAALTWNTNYKWKIRVRRTADNLFQPYTGLASFTTDSAGQPTLTAPINNSWQTTLTPTFTGTTFNAEVITTFRIRLYEADGVTLTWDSGDLAGSGTSFSKVYNGANALVAGRTYRWQARYVKSTGPTGNYSALADFHINAAPQSPQDVTPVTGAILGELAPTFSATFVDPDEAQWADYPVQMEIEVRNNVTDALIATQVKTTGLTASTNSIVWDGTPALAYETVYKWRVRYRDSKNVDGEWSPYITFKPSQPSVVAITAPGSTITSPQVTVTWTHSSPAGKAQANYRVRVRRDLDDTIRYDSNTVISSTKNHVIPAGYLINNTDYVFEVTAVDTDGI